MKHSTITNLKSWAIEWISTSKAQDYLSRYQQKAIAIHLLLCDGEWRNASSIAKEIELSQKAASDLLRVLKEPFGIESHKVKGYRLSNRQNQITEEKNV